MLRILHLGLGEIGKGTIRDLLAQSPAVKLVAAVDPAFAGQNLRTLMANKAVPALPIHASLADALRSKPHVATMTTGSRTIDVRDTLEQLIRAGVHVVSTCEELAFPTLRAPKIAAQLDRLAKKHAVAILGTGINPGFAMDAFALACTAPCPRVRSIKIIRSLDAAHRRQQLQKKIGAAMPLPAVQKLIRQHAIGHVGLSESIALLAHGLNWPLQSIREKFTPIVAHKPVRSPFFTVYPGQVRGLLMTASGIVRGKPLIQLELTMALGAPTFDEVQITPVPPSPPLTIRTTTGFHGDSSTTALLVNAARRAPCLPPGLRTMLDLLQIRSLGE